MILISSYKLRATNYTNNDPEGMYLLGSPPTQDVIVTTRIGSGIPASQTKPSFVTGILCGGNSPMYFTTHTVDGSEIPNNHQGWSKNPVNNGKSLPTSTGERRSRTPKIPPQKNTHTDEHNQKGWDGAASQLAYL